MDLPFPKNPPLIVPGRIMRYVLTDADCEIIEARRAHMKWLGFKETQGNPVTAGQVVPAMITVVWNAETGYINGQAFLDGFDSLWLLSRQYDETRTPGTWHWGAHD